ncbi:MAG: NAD/NADP octopine/nopaline dehydrogenase family protein [Proteobacteria bacterium]|nr:NAD/NADP octopine/nopaline dehydrogenase family protein [Pseudomonadota bacterium]
MKVGILGAGGIGLASAAWMAQRGHDVMIWSPRGSTSDALRRESLKATGVLEATMPVKVADGAGELAQFADVLLLAIPLNGHRSAMDAVLPHLRAGQMVIVSSMGSLSALYLYEAAIGRGVPISVASFGTTVLTARRQGPAEVRIMTRRTKVGVSCLPCTDQAMAMQACEILFGPGFIGDENALATTLANINPVAHGPLALFNWTRIERGENWPQYHFMTPRVAAVIEQLDAERMAIAGAFGLRLRTLERHFAQSFNTQSAHLADIAAELHDKRGGPPGPTDVKTRFLSEDVPYGLVFTLALSHLTQVSAPATEATAAMAGLILGEDFAAANDLIFALRVPSESVDGLLARVNARR